MDQEDPFGAKQAGSFLRRHRLSHELPCAGDWVCLNKQPGDDFGVVHAVLERSTSLRGKSAGSAIEYQTIAANLDDVVIVQSCHFDFNLKRLERYFVMVMEGGAEPYILLTKTDLVDPVVPHAQLAEIGSAGIAAPILTVSNLKRDGVDDLEGLLLPGETYCLSSRRGLARAP